MQSNPSPFAQPPQPPRRRNRRRLWLILGGVAVLLFACIIASIIATQSQQPQTSAQAPTATAAPAQAQHTPARAATPTTATVSGTGTSLAATHGTPRLGAPLTDFVGKYGQPNDHSSAGQPHFLRSNTSNVDGLILSNLYGPNVDSVTVQRINNETWTMSQAQAVCLAYAPADAHKVRQVSLTNSTGIDVLYTSAQLAHAGFPASAFTDANQNPVAAGTFDVQYLTNTDGSVDSCSLMLGAQQTQG